MKTTKQLAAEYKELRDGGLSPDAAKNALTKMYGKVQIFDDDGNEVAVADIEFAETKAEGEEEATEETAEETAKAVVSAIQKGFASLKQKTVPAVAKDHKEEGKNGFKSYGEYLGAVYKAQKGLSMDSRLSKDLSSHSGETGGYLVPSTFGNEILSHALEASELAGLCDHRTTEGNNYETTVDPTTPYGNGGITVHWVKENTAGTASNLKLQQLDVKLHKAMALVHLPNELSEDSFFNIETVVGDQASAKIGFEIDDKILNGTGAGTPLGILHGNFNGLVGQARATSNQIETADVLGINSKLLGFGNTQAMGASRWIAHSSTLPQIGTLTIGNQPAFIPPGLLPNAPAGALQGMPLVYSETAQALGTKGDLSLINFSKYLLVTKKEGLRADLSVDFKFDTDQTSLRYVFRVGGQPVFDTVATDKNGGGTKSPYVTLNA